jgi:hypothetical protein
MAKARSLTQFQQTFPGEGRLDELMARAPMHSAGVKLQNMIKRRRSAVERT